MDCAIFMGWDGLWQAPCALKVPETAVNAGFFNNLPNLHPFNLLTAPEMKIFRSGIIACENDIGYAMTLTFWRLCLSLNAVTCSFLPLWRCST
jgi:hypothetical protein